MADIPMHEQIIQELYTALKAAQQHLDYCGYGDKWEREWAQEAKLPELLDTTLEKYKQYDV